MADQNSQNIDVREEAGFKYHRGSALSIFGTDRREDFVALVCALLIAFFTYVLVK